MSPTQRQMLDGPRSTFQVGEALSKTLSVWGSNLIPFVLVTLIVNAPTLFFMRRTLFAVEEKEAQLWSALASLSGIGDEHPRRRVRSPTRWSSSCAGGPAASARRSRWAPRASSR